jgi:hypothetical protein
MTRAAGESPPPDEHRTLSSSRTKLEILLNPEEPDTVALLAKMDEIVASTTLTGREERSAEMLAVARQLLKREWVRIKSELK